VKRITFFLTAITGRSGWRSGINQARIANS
jgi:hypothetical protein